MPRQLDDWLDGYLLYTKDTEPPALYHTWVGISVLAALLKRKCKLELGHLRFYPNMYVVLVGPPGRCRKGVAMSLGQKILEELDIEIVAESITREALIQTLRRSNDTDMNPVDGKAIAHCSLTVFSTELAVFLGDYNENFIMTLVKWFDCEDRFRYVTKNMGHDHIHGVWFNLIGATTPALLREKINTAALGGGLTSRIVFVTEFDRAKNVAVPHMSPESRDAQGKLLNDAAYIHEMVGDFTPTQEFYDYYTKWYDEQWRKPPFKEDPRFADYVERRPMHVVKLSMILSAARSDQMIVEECDLIRAIRILTLTEQKMPYAFTGVGKSSLSELIDLVSQFLAKNKVTTVSELYERFKYDAEPGAMDQVMDLLQKTNLIDKEFSGSDIILTFKPPKKKEEDHETMS